MANYWYYTTFYQCPLCGNMKTTQKRMYTPKPAKYEDRNTVIDIYDYCEETRIGQFYYNNTDR